VPTEPLLINGLHNPVILMLRALPSNGRCLQNHCLAKGLYATILLGGSHVNMTLVAKIGYGK
jgi:hypothetical protein